jgi:hypothetical protein
MAERTPWPEIPLGVYAGRLPVVRRRVWLEAARSLALPAFQGALWHAVVGRALKDMVCTVPPGVCAACPRQPECAYPAIMEPTSPREAAGPLGRGARIPGPLVFDTGPWGSRRVASGEPFPLDYALIGPDERRVSLIEDAITRAAAAGLGRERIAARVVESSARGDLTLPSDGAGETRTIGIDLVTPLRLTRDGSSLRRFDLRALARDLTLRLAAIGHYHGRQPWPAPWTRVLAEAERAVVRCARVRWVDAQRYSARQRRRVAVGGLLGQVGIEDAGPELCLLLAVGAVVHAGKGASMGLGELALTAAT